MEPETQLLRAAEQLQDAIRRRRSSRSLSPSDCESDDEDASNSEKENSARASNGWCRHQRLRGDSDARSSRVICVSEWERRGLLRMSELSLSRHSEDDAALRAGCSARSGTSTGVDPPIGELTRHALDWMQRDTEQLARQTRATQELLFGVVAIINDVFAQQLRLGGGAAYPLIDEVQSWTELSVESVEKLVGEWEDVLLGWRTRGIDVERQAREREQRCREVCDTKVEQLTQMHAAERDELTREIARLVDASEVQQMACEDYAGALQRALAQLPQPCDDSRSPNELACEREIMGFKARLKGAELHYLHWQMACEDELTRSRRTDERLGMLLDESASARQELEELRSRLARSIHVDALKVYQQKIALLEDQVHDMKQQIVCDHEQFVYEHEKWTLEKKHLGKDVEEIQDVSVKVLKMVLIREKLLKRQERRLQKRVLALDDQQRRTTEQCGALLTITHELMQECALFLVALQDHATSTSRPPHNAASVKPIQIKKLLKRLRRVQHVVEAEDTSIRRGADLESMTTPVSEECSTSDETALWDASSSEL